jgi:actin related protein 2/3 complex subunit 1A/1B
MSFKVKKLGLDDGSEPVLSETISCHSFNGDNSMCAVCPGTNEIKIYQTNMSQKSSEIDISKWKLLHTLTEHTHLVTCIDWGAKKNRILSCSQDRNAYVWDLVDAKSSEGAKQKEKIWKPVLVMLRINRAALTCKWSPEENKFAVGTGERYLAVCHFEKENNWWISKSFKNFKSSVLDVVWHPTDNTILATTSSDCCCQVVRAYLKGVDPRPEKKVVFGEILGLWRAKGWVHSVKFSPSGTGLAFASHDSSITFIEDWQKAGSTQEKPTKTKEDDDEDDINEEEIDLNEQSTVNTDPLVQILKLPTLPIKAFIYLNETTVAGVGFNFSPVILKKEDQWVFKGLGDLGDQKKDELSRTALQKFQKSDKVGSNTDTSIKTRHKNFIHSISPLFSKDDRVNEFVTSCVDGRILLWKTADLSKVISGLKV